MSKYCWCGAIVACMRHTLKTNRLSSVHMFSPQLIHLDIADSSESVYANQSGSETAHKSCIKEPPCKCPICGCQVDGSCGLHFCTLHAHAFAHGVNAPGTLWRRIEQRILIPGPKESNKGRLWMTALFCLQHAWNSVHGADVQSKSNMKQPLCWNH